MAVILAIANQNRGAGKTVTAANVSAGFARAGRRTLAVDCDPEAHLTRWLLGRLAGQQRDTQPEQDTGESFVHGIDPWPARA